MCDQSASYRLNYPWVAPGVNEQPYLDPPTNSIPNIRTFTEWLSVLGLSSTQLCTYINTQDWFTQTPAPGMVTSFNGRTGAVVPEAGDYGSDEITNDSAVTGATVTDALEYLLANLNGNAYWHAPVVDALGAVPGGPSDGERYLILSGSPSGAWSGHPWEIAIYDAGGASWSFEATDNGSFVYALDEAGGVYVREAGVFTRYSFDDRKVLVNGSDATPKLLEDCFLNGDPGTLTITAVEDSPGDWKLQLTVAAGGGTVTIIQDIPANTGSTTAVPSVAAVEDELALLQSQITANAGAIAAIPGMFSNNRKKYDLRAEFGLNPVDGSKSLATLGISASDPEYSRAKQAWEGIFVPRMRLYGSEAVDADFTNLNWGVVCHMEALFRGFPFTFTRDTVIASNNHIIWPQGRYYINFPLWVTNAGMSGQGSVSSANKNVETGGTLFQIDHQNWLGWGSSVSDGLIDRTPIRTHSYGQGFSNLGYVEQILLYGFTVDCNGAGWVDPSVYFSGVGFHNIGELGFLTQVYARNTNNHGIHVRAAGPAVLGNVSVFDCNEGGVCVEGIGSLGNLIFNQISGDDNGEGNLFVKDGTKVTGVGIKHEVGLSASRARWAKSNPSINAQGWVQVNVQGITHAAGAASDIPVLFVVKHKLGDGSRFEVGDYIAWNHSRHLLDLTERTAEFGDGVTTSFSGTATASASRPITAGSFQVRDNRTRTATISDANGITLTNVITIPVATGVTVKRGSVEIYDSGTLVARLRTDEAGNVAEWFDPQHDAVAGAARGASGSFNLATGTGSVTFTSNPLPVGAEVRWKYEDDIIGLDDGAGAIGGIDGISGTVNYTTGAYSFTMSTALANWNYGSNTGGRVYYSSNRVYGNSFGGTSYVDIGPVIWKNNRLYQASIEYDWPFQATPAEFANFTDRPGVKPPATPLDWTAGTPVWNKHGAGVASTNGLHKGFYNVEIAANTQVAYSLNGIERIEIRNCQFNNIGGSDKYLANNIYVNAAGIVYCNGVPAATQQRYNGANIVSGAFVNALQASKWVIIPASPINITEIFGRTAFDSLFFSGPAYGNDPVVELYT